MASSAKVTYSIPTGSYEYIKLVYKQGGIPASITDGTAVDILPDSTECIVDGLSSTEGTTYYFVIFTDKSVSDEFIYTVSEFTSKTFNKTGNVETFVVPKTGKYKLETWGAQGGNASDGTNTARGGYGSYTVCEIELREGQTIYVNVGGQDGYNCGGSSS